MKPLNIKSCAGYGVKIAMWEGEKGISFTVEKSYKDADGSYKNTKYFNANDLAVLMMIIPRAIAAADDAKTKPLDQGSAENDSSDIPF